MYTNTLRVTLQHTMDNVVSQYVLFVRRLRTLLKSAVYRLRLQQNPLPSHKQNRSDL